MIGKTPFFPVSRYKTYKIYSIFSCYLSDTHLIVDETALQEGQLNENGKCCETENFFCDGRVLVRSGSS